MIADLRLDDLVDDIFKKFNEYHPGIEKGGDPDAEDYILNANSAWLDCGGVVLWIRKDGSGGVIVEAYRPGEEMDMPLAEMEVTP